MTEQASTRKPTAAQRRMIEQAIDSPVGEVVSTSRRDDAVIARCAAAGWVDRYTSHVTRAGYIAVGRADRFALPEVQVGDLLRYVTHTGCVVRVRQVLDGGRIIMATHVSACGVCMMRGDRDGATRHEPDLSHMRPQTLDGVPADAWRMCAYLVEPVPAADAEQIERDILDTLDAHVADRKAHDRGELPLPRTLYADTIRPELLDWPAGRKMRDLTPGQRLVQSRRAGRRLAAELSSPAFAAAVADDGVQRATGAALAAADEPAAECGADLTDWPFGACSLAPGHDGEHDRPGPARRREPAPAVGETFELVRHVDLDDMEATERRDEAAWREQVALVDAADEATLGHRYGHAPDKPAPDPAAATPRYPAGTSEYERYAAELTAELRKWQRGESPEYGDAEPETAADRLSEEYGQSMLDRDENPTDDGLIAWLAEQVERLRVEVAARDAARRAGLGVVDIARAYGVQLVKGDAPGAAAALNALQNHVGGLLAALALAGGEQVAAARDERDRALRAWLDEPLRLPECPGRGQCPAADRGVEHKHGPTGDEFDRLHELYRIAKQAGVVGAREPVDEPAPFEVGDRVTWGPAGQPENRGLVVWTVRRVWRDDRGWHVGAVQNGGVGETGTAAPAEQFHRLPAMPAEHSVITFGYDHKHPDTGERLDKAFMRIPGDRELARARAFALLGNRWAFDYPADRFEQQGQIERYGLIEVATPSEAVGMRQFADDATMREYVERQIAGHELDRLASSLRYGTDGR